jgi:hypothetical protein
LSRKDDYPGGWFGESWGAPVCDEQRHLPIPLGEKCPECDTEIELTDNGMLIPSSRGLLAYHRICFLRTVIPCEMWTDEMRQDMPPRWAEHMKEHHQREDA